MSFRDAAESLSRLLGELRVPTLWAIFQVCMSFGDFGQTFFGKRMRIHCFLSGNTVVALAFRFWPFSEVRMNNPDYEY
jgi:hypothetical protein